MDDKLTCLSYWYPRLEAAGLPVPRTTIINAPKDIINILDGHTPEGWTDFESALQSACYNHGLPCFLRTGYGSGKHQWGETCYVTDPNTIADHVYHLVEWSELVSMIGLPYDVFAVRTLIKTRPVFKAFLGFPVTREFRVFARDGAVEHTQPYWPLPRREVARIVENSDFVHEFLSSIERFGRETSLPARGSTSPLIPFHDLDSRQRNLVDQAAEFYKNFSLPLFQTQIRNEQIRYLGCARAGYFPEPKRLAILCAGLNHSRNDTTKRLMNQLNSFRLDLLDLYFRSEGGNLVRPSGFADPLSLKVNTEASITIEDAGQICENGFIVFHEIKHNNPRVECQHQVMCYFQENANDCIINPSVSNWRDLLAGISLLSEYERQEIHWLAIAACRAIGDGYWSVDLLEDKDGDWWITDLAIGKRSFKWDSQLVQ